MAEPQTPLQQAIDRLALETQYLRDVLHVAGAGRTTTISTGSLRQTFEGLAAVLDVLRGVQAMAPATSPAPGGAPAVPVAGGG